MPDNFENKEFWKRLHKEFLPKLKITKKDLKNGISESIMDGILGKPNTKPAKIIQLNKTDNFLRELLHEYSEIQDTIEQIRISGQLITKFPSSFKNIPKVKYFRLIHGSYLNELYIYDQRVERFLALLAKRCKKAGFLSEENKIIGLQKHMKTVLDKAITIRGRHVHLRRFKTDKIEQLEMLDRLKDFKYLKTLQTIEYRKLRKETHKEIMTNADELEKIFHTNVYKIIGPITFNKLLGLYKKEDKLNVSRASSKPNKNT